MASVYHLIGDALKVKQDIVDKYSEYAESNRLLYFSAVRIQKTWRGYVVRKMIKNWHKAATTIQRFVRGWLVRWHLPERYREYYEKMCEEHYHRQATIIQAAWRGYWIRKTVRLKEILAERREMMNKSNAMQQSIRDAFAALRRQKELELLMAEKAKMAKVLENLFDYHHLLRTRQIEGVLSIHDSFQLSTLEKILKNFNYVDFMRKYNKLREQANEIEHDSEDTPKEIPKDFNLTPRIDRPPYERLLMNQY